MKDLNYLIVDDEQHCVDVLAYELKAYGIPSSNIHTCTDANDAISIIKSIKPDLTFLDIDMPVLNGFEILKKAGIHCSFIVTTAFEKYALQAIKAQAVDFLLKPVNQTELKVTLNNYKKKQNQNIHYSLETIKRQLTELQQQRFNSIAIPDSKGIRVCQLEDILALSAETAYTQIEMNNGENLTSSKNLGFYEEILPNKMFLRVHRKHIINVKKVKYVNKSEGGTITLINNRSYTVSRSRMKELKTVLSFS